MIGARYASLALTLVVLALGAMTFRVVRDGEESLAECEAAFNRGDLPNAVLHARRAAIAYAPGAPHTRAALARLRAVAVGSEGVGDTASARLAWGALRGAALETRSFAEPYATAREALSRIPGPSAGGSLLLLVGFALSGGGLGWVAARGLTPEGRLIPRAFTLGAVVFAVGVACWTLAAYRA